MIMAALRSVGGIVLTLGLLATTIGVAAAAQNAWSRASATVGGRITAIEASPVHSFDQTVWIGTDTGGVYRSSDAALSFTATNQGLSDLNVNALAVSPELHLDRVVLAGTDTLLFRSTDRGTSWASVQGLPTGQVVGLAFSPGVALPRSVYAAVAGQGVYRSDDLGQTWSALSATELTVAGMRGLSIADARGNNFHLLIWNDQELFLSDNSGQTFSLISNVASLASTLRFESAALTPDYRNSQTLLVGTRANGIYRSVDAGASYAQVLATVVGRVRAFGSSPEYGSDMTAFAATSSGGVYRSTDAGASWTARNTNLTFTDVTDLTFSNTFRTSGQMFVAGARGQVAGSGTRGDDWWTNPLIIPSGSIAGVGFSSAFATDSTIVVGTQNGVAFSGDAGASWTYSRAALPEGAVNDIAVSPTNYAVDRIVLVAIEGVGVYRTTAAGLYWFEQNTGLTSQATAQPRVVAFSPDMATDNTALMGGATGVFRSTTGGSIWEQINGIIPATDSVVALAIAPGGGAGRDIFAGTLAHGVFRTSGFNDGWEQKITGMTSLAVWDLAVSPTYLFDGTVLAATDEGLFVSTDRGETWNLVAGISSARAVAFSPAFATDATAFAADAAAAPTIYASFDGLQTWSPLGSALPQGAVLDLAPSPLYSGGGDVYAGTSSSDLYQYTLAA